MRSFFPSQKWNLQAPLGNCVQVHVSPQRPSPADNNGMSRTRKPSDKKADVSGGDWSPGRGNLGPKAHEASRFGSPLVSLPPTDETRGEPKREAHGFTANSSKKIHGRPREEPQREKPKPGQGQISPGGRGGAEGGGGGLRPGPRSAAASRRCPPPGRRKIAVSPSPRDRSPPPRPGRSRRPAPAPTPQPGAPGVRRRRPRGASACCYNAGRAWAGGAGAPCSNWGPEEEEKRRKRRN